ncbi:hypothetical protein [Microbacterium sp. No. 7]|uniref:hypothetical protein n=1 Tax=Microbacterium sp. No. 7 TaxID=1714373 RepID=UPI0006ED3B14|nr:hypothetical protein [Microbacterium sp. No. 7]ALJ20281.1 hypothetical protein AOA12_10305 [Microbacterium sp. No. 7]
MPSAEPADVLEHAATAILDAVDRAPTGAALVVIDGCSGAGKSSLAQRLVFRWRDVRGVQLIALDAACPDWDGLADGARMMADGVMIPHHERREGRWRRWDWNEHRWAETHVVTPDLPLIVEGSGALTPAAAAVADVSVWLDSPASSRQERAFARDGDGYRPYWDRWAAQEREHIARNDPRSLAHLVFEVP